MDRDKRIEQALDESLKELLEAGFIEIHYNENLEATFTINEKGREVLKDASLGDIMEAEIAWDGIINGDG
jgi:DNA-binding PadR family transcriptional regulator